jgi:putative transposase
MSIGISRVTRVTTNTADFVKIYGEGAIMPRAPRARSQSGIYHIMVRGIARQDVFLAGEDRMRYLETLDKTKHRADFDILGYCLMGNHIHLLLMESPGESISQTMHRIGTSYVRWFNSKYDRVGHLFQGRFLSVPVEQDPQFLAVLRYIHQNPVKAGIASTCLAYPWSSHSAYDQNGFERIPSLTNTSLAIGIAGGLRQLLDYLNTPGDDTEETACDIMFQEAFRISDNELRAFLRSLLPSQSTGILKDMPKDERDSILRELGTIPGVSFSQIARVTGLSKATVFRAQRS